MIEQTIAQNRADEKLRSQSTRPWMFPVGLAVIGASLLFGYYFLIHKQKDVPEETQVAVPSEQKIQFPDWWPEETRLSAAKLRNADQDIKQIFDGLIASAPSERATAYQTLISSLMIRNSTDDNYRDVWNLALDFFSFEPDSATQIEIAESLVDAVIVDELPANANEVEWSFRANELGYQFVNELRPSAKIVELISTRLEAKTGHFPQNNTQYLSKSQAVIANAQWRNFEDLIWTEPQKALPILSTIATQTKSKLTEPVYDALLSDAVSVTLEASPDQWQGYGIQRLLNEVIKKTEKNELVRWIDISETTSNNTLASWLRLALADRLNLSKPPNDTASFIKELRKLAMGVESLEAKLEACWKRWRLEMDQKVSSVRLTANTDVAPQKIANATHYATLGVLLFSKQPEQLLKFDLLLKSGPPRLRSSKWIGSGSVHFRNATGQSPRSWDEKSLADLINKLKQDSGASDIVRRATFEQISKMADRFKDINLEQAEVLASFCLTANDDDQLLVVQQHLPQMKHWLNLSLTFLDQIKTASLSKDRLVAISESLSGKQFLVTTGRWKEQLHHEFLKHVQQSLEFSVRQGKQDNRVGWELLAFVLSDQYDQRLEALGASRRLLRKWTSLQQKQLLAIHLMGSPEASEEEVSKKIATDVLVLEQLDASKLRQTVILELRFVDALMKRHQASDQSEIINRFTRQVAGLPQPAQKFLFSQITLHDFFKKVSRQ